MSYDNIGAGRVSTVTDPIGRQISFTYDAKSRIATMTNPAGGVTQYTYDDTKYGQLTRVTFPDARYRDYRYDNPTNKFALTSIYAGTELYVTFDYETSTGRAMGNKFGVDAAAPNAPGKISISFNDTTGDSVTQDPNGASIKRTFYIPAAYPQFPKWQGKILPKTIEYTVCPTCSPVPPPLIQSFMYDSEGRISSQTNANNITSN